MSQKLTPRQLQAIYWLVQGRPALEVAQRMGMRRETLSKWKKQPEFQAEYDKIIAEIREEMRYRLTRLADDAITAAWDDVRHSSRPKALKTALNVLKLLGMNRVLPKNQAKQELNWHQMSALPAPYKLQKTGAIPQSAQYKTP